MISRKSGQTDPKAASSCCVREASLVTNELLLSAGTLKGLKTKKNLNRMMKKRNSYSSIEITRFDRRSRALVIASAHHSLSANTHCSRRYS